MEYKIYDLIDIPKIQELMDSFYVATGIPSSMVANDGDVLTRIGWQDICINFHRKNPGTEMKCLKSASQIRERLKDRKLYVIYKCPNGLIDAAAPIVVAGEHLANVMTGQFLFKKPSVEEIEYFRTQAKEFGFDESSYLKALSKVPIIPEERVQSILNYFSKLAGILAEVGFTQLKQNETSKALQKAHDVLELRVKERTAELAEANQQLKQEIIEHRRTEEELQESEKKYRTILENIEEGYYELDITGNFTFFNDSVCKILGYSRDELIGMNSREHVDPETAERLFQTYNAVYRTGKPAKALNYEIIRKDGTKRRVETSVSLLSGAEGQRIGFRGIARDVTERVLAEEEKGKLQAQLQQAQKIEAIGTLAGGIAHNFNNLLMGIQGNTSLMSLGIDSNHTHYERLMAIEKQVQMGAKLTSQLLGYARKGRYEVRPINLNQLIKETSDTFGMTRKEITIHTELFSDLFAIKADQGQIEQVLLNMYVNAADAMFGGGDLILKTMNATDKDLSGKPYQVKPGNYVLLTVRDTGIGMDKKTMERIFDPFFTTKEMVRSTGLGLASVYGIIKAHGGYIDVDSEKGKGTTFYIYLPASDKVIPKVVKPAERVMKGSDTILFVDDEEPILEVGVELLRTLGYAVLEARSGKEAIEIYESNKNGIALVVLDMIMPEMGGGETYDRLKEIDPNIKVLLSSGYSIDGQATEILERGCDDFIQKPFNMKQLSQKIREVLDKK